MRQVEIDNRAFVTSTSCCRAYLNEINPKKFLSEFYASEAIPTVKEQNTLASSPSGLGYTATRSFTCAAIYRRKDQPLAKKRGSIQTERTEAHRQTLRKKLSSFALGYPVLTKLLIASTTRATSLSDNSGYIGKDS
jgi:hypothetical protein